MYGNPVKSSTLKNYLMAISFYIHLRCNKAGRRKESSKEYRKRKAYGVSPPGFTEKYLFRIYPWLQLKCLMLPS